MRLSRISIALLVNIAAILISALVSGAFQFPENVEQHRLISSELSSVGEVIDETEREKIERRVGEIIAEGVGSERSLMENALMWRPWVVLVVLLPALVLFRFNNVEVVVAGLIVESAIIYSEQYGIAFSYFIAVVAYLLLNKFILPIRNKGDQSRFMRN